MLLLGKCYQTDSNETVLQKNREGKHLEKQTRKTIRNPSKRKHTSQTKTLRNASYRKTLRKGLVNEGKPFPKQGNFCFLWSAFSFVSFFAFVS